jgi:endonuclease G
MALLGRLFYLLLASAAGVLAQPDRFGLPACGPGAELANRSFFVLCHNSSLKVPVWVAYELRPEHLSRVASRPHRFRRDRDLATPGATDADYRNSGFNRGHMAPAADFAWSASAISATFLLSNAVPQRAKANSGVWARLEAAVRRIAADSDEIYIFSGPVFESENPQRIGAGGVAVPEHTFKVILAIQRGTKFMCAAIVPNSDTSSGVPADLTTTVDEVERRTGLDFFSALDDAEERELESSLGSCATSPSQT